MNHRVYRYIVDHMGLVHHDGAKTRTLATAQRDPRFLDALYKGLRRRRDGQWAMLCAGEINYVSLMDESDVCVVFHSLVDDTLRFAGTFEEPFDATSLKHCADTGRLYHPLVQQGPHLGALGLVGARIAHDLAAHLVVDDVVHIDWAGQRYPVAPLVR